jgi:hypothetical protein
MDSINHTSIVRKERRPIVIEISPPTIHMPLYVSVILILIPIWATICISWVAIVRQNVPIANPFSDYNTIFPGQRLGQVIERGFDCTQYFLEWDQNYYCTLNPTDGPFWYINLVATNGIIRSVVFCTRENAITVGDLSMLWGRPRGRYLYRLDIFSWPEIRAVADAYSQDKRFSYYLPVTHISFSNLSR